MLEDNFEHLIKVHFLKGHEILTGALGQLRLPYDEYKAVLSDLSNRVLERCYYKLKWEELVKKGQVIAAIKRQALDVFAEWSRQAIQDERKKEKWRRRQDGGYQESERSNLETKDQLNVIQKLLKGYEFDIFYGHGLERASFEELARTMNMRAGTLRKIYWRVRAKLKKIFLYL